MTAQLVGDACLALLVEFVGRRIDRIRRIHYELAGEANFSRGPIEISAGALVAWFDQASDGAHLRGHRGVWVDVFEEDPTEESRLIAQNEGKLSAFDVTALREFECIVGHETLAIRPTVNLYEDVVLGFGFELVTDAGVLAAWVDSDEFYVAVRRGQREPDA